MYKILIVDDEAIVREGIEHTIDWGALGFEFTGSYENGVDAAAAVEELRPAVVITDIYMPFSDGLDLTEYILSRYPETKVILISGFDKFQYAQRAVKLGAYDYLLKPVTAEELRELLKRVRFELGRAETKRTENRAQQVREATRLLFERSERDALENAVLRLRGAGVRIPNNGGCLMAASFDATGKPAAAPADVQAAEPGELAALLRAPGTPARNPADSGGSRGVETLVDHDERVLAIVAGPSPAEAERHAAGLAANLLSTARRKLGRTVTVGIGGPFAGARQLAGAYRRAARALEYRYVAGGDRIIRCADLPSLPPAEASADSRTGEWSDAFRAAGAALVRSISACDRASSAESVARLVNEMRESFVSRSRAHLQIHAILVRINDIREKLEERPVGVEELTALPTLDEVELRLVELALSTINRETSRRLTYAGRKAEEAVRFINNNFAVPTLTLRNLCREIGVSPSYLSSIFKTHTGKTLIEYLTGVRIDRAKHLLQTTDMKSYEVARSVGYPDQRYFCTIFKRISGRSPIEFRRETGLVEIGGQSRGHA